MSTGLRGAALLAAWCSLGGSGIASEAPVTPLAVQVDAAPGRGVTISLADLFSLNLRARAQLRGTVLVKDAGTSNEINVKTLRLNLQGHVLSPSLRYFVQLALGGGDFEAGSSTPLFDAYVEWSRLRDLRVRAGQFFVPFDRARTVREFALHLVDRPAAVTELSLDRDVGVMLSSEDLGGLGGRLGYNLAIFGGEGKNRFGGSGIGFLYVGRFTVRPFGLFDDDQEGDLQRLHRPRLALGVAGAFNQSTTRQRSTTGNTVMLGGFDYVHAAGDLVFKYAGAALLAEVLYRQALSDFHDGVMAGTTTALREWSRSALGYLIQVGVMVHPRAEVVARWEQLLPQGNTDPTLARQAATQGRQLGGGGNLYLNGHLFKLQADYFYLFGDGLQGGQHQARLQLDASL